MKNAPPTLLVHEFVTGGGLAGSPLPPGLAAEGGAMLRAVLADLAAWGRYRTVATVDSRLAESGESGNLAAHEVVAVEPGRFHDIFSALAARADAALIIAPEQDDVLARLNQAVLAAGTRLLGCEPRAVRTATDKWACHRLFQQAGLPCPETVRVPRSGARAAALAMGFPLVAKPVDGLDCQGVGLAVDEPGLDRALELVEDRDELLLQRFVPGVSASVSLLASAGGVKALCLNRQDVVPGLPFAYQGGASPLDHPLAARAMALAEESVRLIPGLRGYVGVDMVLEREECRLLEINPRLTTSYLAVTRVVNVNMAQAMADACLDGRLPERVSLSGRIVFHKEGSIAGS